MGKVGEEENGVDEGDGTGQNARHKALGGAQGCFEKKGASVPSRIRS